MNPLGTHIAKYKGRVTGEPSSSRFTSRVRVTNPWPDTTPGRSLTPSRMISAA
jgi:hypothetical protein